MRMKMLQILADNPCVVSYLESLNPVLVSSSAACVFSSKGEENALELAESSLVRVTPQVHPLKSEEG